MKWVAKAMMMLVDGMVVTDNDCALIVHFLLFFKLWLLHTRARKAKEHCGTYLISSGRLHEIKNCFISCGEEEGGVCWGVSVGVCVEEDDGENVKQNALKS